MTWTCCNGAYWNTQNLLVFLIVGVVAGFLAGKVMKGTGFGFLGDLVVGVIGAFLGAWMFALLGITAYGLLGSLLTAFAGALVLLFALRLIKGKPA
jgi:uncharacterized membrane protein YeaQ/YmgE (transglycosylase-associated protein family)